MWNEEHFQSRQLDEADFEEFDALLRYAFQVTSRDMARVGWSETELVQSKKPVLTQRMCSAGFTKNHLASQIVIYPMEVNIQGKYSRWEGLQA